MTLAGDSLIYSTYLGGSNDDYAIGIAVDSESGVWVVGRTDSDDFPIAGGPNAGQQRKFGGGVDGFLARVAPNGVPLAYSTYLGGPGFDFGLAVTLDRTGSVYVTGIGSPGFPITTGMKPCTSGGGAFVVRLRGRGTQARYATCLGPGVGQGISTDANFNAYVTGWAFEGFPTTPGVFQRKKLTPNALAPSGFVTKLGSAGKVAYSTYFGGNDGYTVVYGIGVDRNGAVYIGGETSATKFPGLPPLTPAPLTGFVSKLTPGARGLSYSQVVGKSVLGLSLFQPTSSPMQIHMVGWASYLDSMDAIVVKME